LPPLWGFQAPKTICQGKLSPIPPRGNLPPDSRPPGRRDSAGQEVPEPQVGLDRGARGRPGIFPSRQSGADNGAGGFRPGSPELQPARSEASFADAGLPVAPISAIQTHRDDWPGFGPSGSPGGHKFRRGHARPCAPEPRRRRCGRPRRAATSRTTGATRSSFGTRKSRNTACCWQPG